MNPIRPAARALAWLAVLLLAPLASAGTVETRDHQTYEGLVRLEQAGRLSIQTSNGHVQSVALDQVRLARFRSSPAEAGRLPGGWRAEDIGDIEGRAGEKDGVLTLNVSGGAVQDPKKPAAHFAHRVLRGDGEIVARVSSVSGPAASLAGVMMRENLEPTSGLVLLAVTPEKRLRLDWRESGWQAIQRLELGAINLPVWLRLVRQEKEKRVTAFRSEDGTRWRSLGQVQLACKVEPFPEDSNHWRPKLFAGLALAGPGRAAEARARFEPVALTARGLLGEYFSDNRFQSFRFARPDDKMEFYWGLGSPSPDLPNDHFSVRWTGQLEPKFSEPYRFHLDADNDAWLWVNGEEVPTASFKKERTAKALPLVAGRKYQIKLEFKEGAGAASVRLGWSSRSQPLEVIAASQLSYTFHARSPDEEAGETRTEASFARGLWLRDGSFIAGAVLAADANAARMAFAGQKEFSISIFKVARVHLRPPQRAVKFEAPLDRPGVLLKNGDFLDSEFKSLNAGSLTVQSVLFGQRVFPLDKGEVVAVVMHPCLPSPVAWEARLVNGSVLRVGGLRPAGDSVRLEGTILGELAIPEKELLEIRSLVPGGERERTTK